MKAAHCPVVHALYSLHDVCVLQAVVSDVPTCGGVQYAQQYGIPTFTYPVPKKGGAPGLTTEELVQQLTQEVPADYVLLAGYLKVMQVAVCLLFIVTP